MDKTPILRPPPRPISGGTNNGARPRRYDYWRTGYGAEPASDLAFWVAQVGEYHCKPGYVTGDFEHGDRTQIFYHLRGDAVFTCSGAESTVGRGDLLVIPPGQAFRYRAPAGVQHHWLALGGHWPTALGPPRASVNALGYDVEVECLLVEMREVLILQQPGYELRAVGIFYQLLARRVEIEGVTAAKETAYPDAVRNAVIYLRENYALAFNAAETAAAVGLSPSHMRALFERWVGESPKRFHTRCRVDRACRLLSEDLPVSEVAYQVGFSDSSHFSRVFKQITGVAPSLYLDRQERQEGDRAGGPPAGG